MRLLLFHISAMLLGFERGRSKASAVENESQISIALIDLHPVKIMEAMARLLSQ